MNWQRVQDSWEELHGSIKTRWPRLTEDDLRYAGGRIDAMVGVLQQRYGIAAGDARRQLAEFSDAVGQRSEDLRLRPPSVTAD